MLEQKIIERETSMDDREQVKKWLEYCEGNNIKPWKFDFKRCKGKSFFEQGGNLIDSNDDDYKYTTSNLRLFIAYRYEYKKDNKIEDRTYRKKDFFSGTVDCDKRVFPIYKVLSWQKPAEDKAKGDTMNSFRTTFTQLLTKSKIVKFDNLKRILKKDSLSYIDNELLDMADDDDREKANKEKNYSDKVTKDLKKCFKNNSGKNGTKFNFEELEAFAGLTHSIGNFIVFPSWINTGRGGQPTCDYWDLTLKNFLDFFLEIDDEHGAIVWKKFIKKYYLQPYVNKYYIPQELWTGHFKSKAKPCRNDDFVKFYKNVNLLIIERGKWITKKLYEKVYSKEELKECSLYQTELANIELHYFDEATTPPSKK